MKTKNFFEEIEEMESLKQKNYAVRLCFTVYRFKVKKKKRNLHSRNVYWKNKKNNCLQS